MNLVGAVAIPEGQRRQCKEKEVSLGDNWITGDKANIFRLHCYLFSTDYISGFILG